MGDPRPESLIRCRPEMDDPTRVSVLHPATTFESHRPPGILIREPKPPAESLREQDTIRQIKRVDVFSDLSYERLAELVRASGVVELPGEAVFSCCDAPYEDALLVVLEGRVRIFRRTGLGREFTLTVSGSGAVFGDPVSSPEGRVGRTLAESLEDSTLLVVGREDLQRLVFTEPQVAVRMMDLLFERLSNYEVQMEDLAFGVVPLRLSRVLRRLIWEQGIRSPTMYRLPVSYTHEFLATMIGANREAVTRAFALLKEADIIEVRRRRICVPDISRLEAACRDDFYL